MTASFNHYSPAVVTSNLLPFTLCYRPLSELSSALTDDRLLAAISFANHRPVTDPRHIDIALPELGDAATVELWYSPSPVRCDSNDGIRTATTDQLLLASLSVEAGDLDTAGYRSYQRLLARIQDCGYPHLLRTWNYLPDINREDDGLERYRAFCRGRYQALATEHAFEAALPAACALGSRSGGLDIYLLAARSPGIQIENPRQVSAFRYPPRYGPRSPSFSRAILKRWGDQHHLYISGTASITGHLSRHIGDVSAQFDEIVTNLSALLTEANRRVSVPLRFEAIKLYLGQGLDPELIDRRLRHSILADIPAVMLRADICRQDLLLEIEGMCVSQIG